MYTDLKGYWSMKESKQYRNSVYQKNVVHTIEQARSVDIRQYQIRYSKQNIYLR